MQGTLGDGSEHRLDVGCGARNHPEDFSRCRLLLQCFRHLSMSLRERLILLLQIRKQPPFSMAITAWSAKVFRSSI